MSIRRTGYVLSVVACLFATAASAQFMGIFGDIRSRIVSTFTAVANSSYVSALFGSTNAYGSAQNAGLNLPTNAFTLPSNVLLSWFIPVEGVVNPNISQSSAGGETFAARCPTSCSSGANLRQFTLNSQGNVIPLSLQANWRGATSPSPFWTAYSVTGAIATAGAGYAPGFYPWSTSAADMSAGSCTVYPAGFFTVLTTMQNSVKVTQPGNCTSNAAFNTINLAETNGTPTTYSVLTLTMGQSGYLGISALPGQHFFGVIGQWGTDAPAGLQGQQFAAFVDGNGNPLSGSPSVSLVSNQTPTTSQNFYYSNTSCPSCVIRTQSGIADIFTTIGTSVPTAGAQANWGGQISTAGMVWGVFPSAASTPDQSVLATLATKAQDPLTYFQSLGTVHSFYQFNPSLNTMVDAIGTNANATAITAVSPTAGSPGTQSIGLTITDYGPSTVYPMVDFSAYTGSIKLSGTYNSSALGGIPTAIQAQISAIPGGSALAGCSSCAWNTITSSVSGGTWSGTVTNVPAGGPYYVSVRASNATNFTQISGPVAIGLVKIWQGQSQMAYIFSSQGGNTFSPSGNLGWFLQGATPNSSPFIGNVSDYINGSPVNILSILPVTPATVPGPLPNSFTMGDSGTAEYQALSNLTATISGTAWPIQTLNFSYSGRYAEVWLNGYLTYTNTLAGSGVGPYTATVIPSVSGAFYDTTRYPGLANANNMMVNSNGQNNAVLGGSMVFKDGSGNTLGGDAAVSTMNVPTSTTCSGATIASCSINYLTGAVSVTFTTAPTGPVKAVWTDIVALAPGGTAGMYDGKDFVGNGDPKTGSLSKLMSYAPFGVNIVTFSQCTMNESEVGSVNYAGGAASLTAKYNYTFFTKYPSIFPGYSATTPVLVLEHFRDATNNSSGSAAPILGCMAWTRDYGLSGANHYYGGSYADDTSQGASPHESNGIYGGMRFGRRAAINEAATLFGSSVVPNQEPTIASATLGYSDDGIGYDSACSGLRASQASNCINITVAMNSPLATSLKTCGTNLNGTGGAGEWTILPDTSVAGTTTSGSNVITVTAYNVTAGAQPLSPGMFLYATGMTPGYVQSVSGSLPNLTVTMSTVQPGGSFTGGQAQFNAANGPCTDGGIGQHVSGFRIGTASVPNNTVGNVYEDGADPYNGSTNGMQFNAAMAFSCRQVAATVVQCVKTTGTWSGGATYLTYGEPWSTARDLTLMGTPGAATGLTVTTPGTCSGSGSTTVAMTGGTVGGEPYITVNYTTAGIQSAYPYKSGANIHVNPTGFAAVTGCTGVIAVPPSCSGTGTPTAPCFGNLISSANVTGQLLYDNSGNAAASGISGTTTANSNVITVSAVTTGTLTNGMILSGTGLNTSVVKAISGSLPNLSVTLTRSQTTGGFSNASATSVVGSVLGSYEPGLPVTSVVGALAGYAITVTP